MSAAVEIGSVLREARRRNGLTQAQVAELAGIAERTLRDIEKGRPGVGLSAVLAVAAVLGLRLEVMR